MSRDALHFPDVTRPFAPKQAAWILPFPSIKKHRVIVNTDAKNEADDQYAIVHAVLTPSFELHGIIAAHFGLHPGRPEDSVSVNLAEINWLLHLMNLEGRIRVVPGAKRAMPDEKTPQPSTSAQLIIDEALKDDPRPLNILFYGPLTDMASAMLIEPEICQRNIHVVWVGGADVPTQYGKEFNLSNDVHAVNVVMRSGLAVSQIPYPLYGHFCVSHAELMEKVQPHGAIGNYLVRQLIEFNNGSREYRSLGDSPAVGVVLAPHGGRWSWQPTPEYDPETCRPLRTGQSRLIRVYESFDARFLLEDFFAKLARFARQSQTP